MFRGSLAKMPEELFAYVVLSVGTTFFQEIGEHMNEPTVWASSTMRSEWFPEADFVTASAFSLFFLPQRKTSCQHLVNFLCIIFEIVFHPSYCHVIRAVCRPSAHLPKKKDFSDSSCVTHHLFESMARVHHQTSRTVALRDVSLLHVRTSA